MWIFTKFFREAFLYCNFEKQLSIGAIIKRYSENMQQICKRKPTPKCDFNSNFIEITLWYGCSPVNLLHIFRTPFYKNTYGGLLLNSGRMLLLLVRFSFSTDSMLIISSFSLINHSATGILKNTCSWNIWKGFENYL